MPPVDLLTFDCDALPVVLTHKGYDWSNRNISINWSGVMSEIWNSGGYKMENKNGEVILFEGLFGTCFRIPRNKDVQNKHFKRMEKIKNIHDMLSDLFVRSNGCLRNHLQRLPIVSFQTTNDVFQFPTAGDLSGYNFNFCPEMVMRDVIRMWNEVNGVLLAISLTTPIFLDGYIDVNPSQVT